MDSLSVVLIVVSAILLIALTTTLYKFNSGSKRDSEEDNGKIFNLQFQLNEKETSIQKLLKEKEEDKKSAEQYLSQLKDNNSKELEKYSKRISELESEISQALQEGTDEIIKKKLSEVDKLIKKNKILEEDLEEAEDEIEGLHKKTKNLQKEKNNIEEQLELEIRKQKKIIEECNQIKDRLQIIEKDFEIRQEALDFVKEILNADLTKDESIRKLYQIVDNIVEYIRGDVRECYTSIYELSFEEKKALFETELLSWALSKKKKWIQGKTSIAFVGEFSAGKTSIVNRILSQDDPNVPRLPVSTKATTAIPTYISGGEHTFFQFVTPDNELKGITPETFRRVTKDVLDQVKGVSSLIQYFVMTYKNPNLERLSILDTPGFNSNDAEDAERTIGVINECDALFWVFDVNAGTVNRSSIKIIKENLTKPLFIVINQIDTKSKSDVDAVENLIRKTLQEEGVTIQAVIRFSKKEPLINIMDPILKIPHDNSRESYLEDLISLISDRVKELGKETKEAQKKSNQIEKRYSKLIEEYNQTIGNLQDDCETVAEIPKYNSRVLRKADYRISQDEYNQFISLLEDIRENRCDELCTKYNEQMDTIAELEISWQEHADSTHNQQRLTECLDALKKRSSKLGSNIDNKTSKYISLNTNRTKESINNEFSGSRTLKSINSSDNKLSSREISEFESLFRWTIIERENSSVKLNWNQVLSIINAKTKSQYSRNKIRNKIPLFGVNDFVNLQSIAHQIGSVINK